MSAIRTHFEVDLRTPAAYLTPHKLPNGRSNNPPKMETTYFNFGGFDWNILLYPYGREPGEERFFVHLNRLTGSDHQCRVRYVMILGEGDRTINSGLLDDISDTNGKSFGWLPRIRFPDIVQRVRINFYLFTLGSFQADAFQYNDSLSLCFHFGSQYNNHVVILLRPD